MLAVMVTVLLSAHSALVEIRVGNHVTASGVRVSLAHVITNAHVVAHEGAVSVICDGVFIYADVVGSDANADLALLELRDGEQCVTAFAVFRPMGALAGERLFARGCPYGDCRRVKSGETLARLDIGGQDRLVTSLFVRPGSSGGPAYDEDGEVVGVVYAYSHDIADHRVTYGLLVPVDRVISFILDRCSLSGGTPITLHVGQAHSERFCRHAQADPVALR